jgi:hypothetical protein
MSMPLRFVSCKAAFLALLVSALARPDARADWVQTDTTLAWRVGTNIVWQFSFDTNKGKPFFHPLTVGGGPPLTNFKPADHPWHYGLWFSWKYINHVNYWEEDRTTGRAEGTTRWDKPLIKLHEGGGAEIELNLAYINPSNRVDLTEQRNLKVAALRNDGSYTLFWMSHFKAGEVGAELDRTPMPNEPKGQVNGGYAGLGLRMAGPPLEMSVLCSTGAVTRFEHDRARPNADSVAFNFTDGAQKPVGGIAICSYPGEAGQSSPWYIINSSQMRFACAAILAPGIRKLSPGAEMYLHYNITIQSPPWTIGLLEKYRVGW